MAGSSVSPGVRGRELSGLGELVYGLAREAPDVEAFTVPGEGGGWQRRTVGEFATEVTALAKGMVAAGVSEGDRVLLVAGVRHDWARVAFAVWSVGAVLVPVSASASVERVAHVVRQTRPAAAVVEGERVWHAVSGLQREVSDLGRVWRLEGGAGEIVRLGAYMDTSAVRFRRDAIAAEDTAVVLYPMSTVSRRMRGVVLSHGALRDAAADVVDRMWPRLSELKPGQASALVDLPLSEISGLASLLACVMGRVRLGLAAPGSLPGLVASFAPTVLVGPAGLLEGVYEGERDRARLMGWDSLGTFNAAADAAVQFDRAPKKSPWRRLSRSMYDWSLGRVREVFGGRVHLAVCWGGGLSERLDRFFSGIGMPVVQVFGMPETAGVFVANAVGDRSAGSVGRALEGREVWVSREGEVHVRGGGLFSEYWGDGEATRGAFREGWLATGVLADMDEDGFVRVRGRLRPQAAVAEVPGRFAVPERAVEPVTEPVPRVEPAPDAAGAPVVAEGAAESVDDAVLVAEFEGRLRAHPLVSQVLVISEGRPFASALITLVRDQLEYWRLVNGRPLSMAPEEIAGDRDLLREVQGLVYEANRSVPRRLAVRSFHVLAEEFTVQSGLVAPSGELRRDAVLRAFSEEIDGLYRVVRDRG
ncbi:AMP-binding protein [Nocardiopsis sp. LOL_012]|uniref:AMP-binding protein n=1 Tax=Nocardiopsis sp. LOL_012 TaxID=3345409 RepID=UPI003A88C446